MADDCDIPSCKITIVGDSGVGKTSIIGRFVTGIFLNDVNSSGGLSYSQKFYEKDGKKVSLHLWDTVGEEKFRALGRNFYRDSYIIIIVYDICNRESFENIKEVWYPDIKNYGEKFKILSLVGNKSDKYEEEEVNLEEAKEYAKEINAQFFLVSANDGSGIENMFQTLADNFFDAKFMEIVNKSKEDRIDSIVLSKEYTKNQSTSNNKCC